MLRGLEHGIEVLIGEKSKKVLGLFGSNEQKKKIILVSQAARRAKLLKIMIELKQTEPWAYSEMTANAPKKTLMFEMMCP